MLAVVSAIKAHHEDAQGSSFKKSIAVIAILTGKAGYETVNGMDACASSQGVWFYCLVRRFGNVHCVSGRSPRIHDRSVCVGRGVLRDRYGT